MLKIQDIISNFFQGHKRSVEAKKQIIYSFGLKVVSVLIGLLYVPLLIDYLDVERYGVWITLTSIVGWFTFFDAGLGNGLRNKLTEALAYDNQKLAQEYVSTTYALISIAFISVLLIFYCINPFLNWNIILNSENIPKEELSLLALIVFTFFFLRFIFQIIGVILMAIQKPAINNIFGPIGNLISLSIIYLLIITAKKSIVLLGFVISFTPLLVLVLASFILFNGQLRDLKPSLNRINMNHAKSLFGLGMKFFLLQISAIVMFSLSNIIIIQVLNPEQVALYNISYKYFLIPIMLFSIIMTPIWSAVTDAFTRNDSNWLKSTMKTLNRISIVFVIGIIVMLLFSKQIYNTWLGDRVDIPLELSMSMALFAIINVIITPYSYFINGIGKLAISIRITIFKIILFIPTAYFLVNTSLGASGVMYATCFFSVISLPIYILQINRIFSGNARGLWGK